MRITVRKFCEQDIDNKIRWINDPANHRYLHYALPLNREDTERWYRRVRDAADRFDGVILADGVPCGLIGLLHIDDRNRKAEFYIVVGESSMKRQGIAWEASLWLLRYAFAELGLHRIYLYTETGNLPAQGLFEKLGFIREGTLVDDVWNNGAFADRFLYAMTHSP